MFLKLGESPNTSSIVSANDIAIEPMITLKIIRVYQTLLVDQKLFKYSLGSLSVSKILCYKLIALLKEQRELKSSKKTEKIRNNTHKEAETEAETETETNNNAESSRKVCRH